VLKKNKIKRHINKKQFEAMADELYEATKNPVFLKQTAEYIFKILDTSHDGEINSHEFLSGFAILSKGSFEEKARLTFKAFDRNEDGKLSALEIKKQARAAITVAAKVYKDNLAASQETQHLAQMVCDSFQSTKQLLSLSFLQEEISFPFHILSLVF
jgi:Ca2+-binding EF-hand superfamily protein